MGNNVVVNHRVHWDRIAQQPTGGPDIDPYTLAVWGLALLFCVAFWAAVIAVSFALFGWLFGA